MSLDKAIESGKEKRKSYRGAAAVDKRCRKKDCAFCRDNKTHSVNKQLPNRRYRYPLEDEMLIDEVA